MTIQRLRRMGRPDCVFNGVRIATTDSREWLPDEDYWVVFEIFRSDDGRYYLSSALLTEDPEIMDLYAAVSFTSPGQLCRFLLEDTVTRIRILETLLLRAAEHDVLFTDIASRFALDFGDHEERQADTSGNQDTRPAHRHFLH